jgi:hypothetical protein
MGKCLVTVGVLYVGCGGLASTQSEAPSQPVSDDTVCAVTDGSIAATWGGTALTLSGACLGGPKLAFIGGTLAFQLCAQDEQGIHVVLSGGAPGFGESAQVYLDDHGMNIRWVANSIPGFTLTVTALRPPGHYIEGTFTGLVQEQDTSTGVQAGPTTSLSGSFRVCRAPDEPPPK